MLFFKLSRLFAALFQNLNTRTSVMLLLGYASISYTGLYLAGETELVNWKFYPYWLVVTASTVGYGDASPVTFYGQMVTSFWVIPAGISLFAMMLTKVGISISALLQRQLKGFGMTNHQNHIAIVGWNGSRTHRLLDLLQHETESTQCDIELYVSSEVDNPFPDKVDMIRVDEFTNFNEMNRGSITAAGRIIIDTESDDITVTTALFCSRYAPQAHVTAYLKNESTASILKEHCPTVEIVPDVSVEMMAKASLDRGSSVLHKELLDTSKGETQYSYRLDVGLKGKSFLDLLVAMKMHCAATVIGYLKSGSSELTVNPAIDTVLCEGDAIYYIADRRLSDDQIKASFEG